MDTNTNKNKYDFDYHQLLASWFSPSFPIGSFNFSHGLEAAIEMNFIKNEFNLKKLVSLLNYLWLRQNRQYFTSQFIQRSGCK